MTVLSKYKTPETFLNIYSPKNASSMIATNGRQGMMEADTPSLTTVKHAFGEKTVSTFLNAFLLDTASFYGMADAKSNPETIYGISDAISLEYYHFKVSELVLFFQLLKSGHFRDSNDNDRGKMYGSFNGEVVMDCLYKFKQERARFIDEQEAEKRREARERMNREAVPPPPGALDLIRRTISSIGHPEAQKRTLENTRHIDENHITEFKAPSAEDKALREKHEAEFYRMLELEKQKQQSPNTK